MQVEDNRSQSLKQKGGAIINKIKGVKNFKIIAVIFIIAIALIIYSGVMAKKSESASGTTSAVMTSDEARLSGILSNIEGAGNVEVMITEVDGVIKGVLVIADGAKQIPVRLRLIDAAATALGVDKRLVNVYGRTG